jgi:hypothetical protein
MSRSALENVSNEAFYMQQLGHFASSDDPKRHALRAVVLRSIKNKSYIVLTPENNITDAFEPYDVIYVNGSFGICRDDSSALSVQFDIFTKTSDCFLNETYYDIDDRKILVKDN